MPARILPPSGPVIIEAARLLREGGLVAFPTETVYGLGADATNAEAVARVFAAKGRPTFNPLIVHVPGLRAAETIAELPAMARTLAKAFWPGPLTLVVPHASDSPVCELATAGLPTIALRAPDHPVARALLLAAERPVAAPSANRSGRVSATRAEHVAEDLGQYAQMIIDAGNTAFGIESTVLGLADGEIAILRPGAVTAEAIELVIGQPLARRPKGAASPTSPGQLESHYAPQAAVRLEARTWTPDEAVLAFGMAPDLPAHALINLSPSGDTIEAAAALFAALRKLDASCATTIAVMPVPETGLGEAINDRLRRAAAPRSSRS